MACSTASRSTLMPRAYVSTAPSTCPRSHGTWPNSRWWAASRRATYSRTWSSGISRPSPYAVMLAGTSAAVPAGPRGRPMSPAESTSPASEPSAVPSWPPKTAPPTEVSIAAIGPSWARICSGTRSPIALVIWAATGSHSLRQTSRVLVSHSARRQASADRMPARQGGSRVEPQVGQAQRLLRRPRAAGSRRPDRRASCDWAICMARSQLTGPEPGLASICCSWARNACNCAGSFGSGPPGSAGQRESERRVGHGCNRTRRPHAADRPRRAFAAGERVDRPRPRLAASPSAREIAR